jgi:uncharacterized protein (TIGR03083 family)
VDNSGDRRTAPPPDDPAGLAQLIRLQDLFADSILLVEASTPVASCGDWTVGDLIDHLTSIHTWAAAMARDQDREPRTRDDSRRDGYLASATDLRETLAALDPDQPTRTLVPDGTVAFWIRRQLHETLIHLWDLRSAGGLGLAVDPVVWADTVDEAVTVMHPRQVRLARTAPAPMRITLTATDVHRSWTLPTAIDDAESGGVSVAGPAEALALLVWGRTALDDPRLTVTGAGDALVAVLGDRFVP